MKTTSKKALDTKETSKGKSRQTKKATAPVIDRDENFSDTHHNRQTRPMTDHEPGTV